MDFDLLSFPPEILAKIFSNIPWDQLINVKLTARKFNYVTEKYQKDMQKPKLYEIIFEDNYSRDGIDWIKINYDIFKTDGNGDITDVKELIFPLSELDELHRFLQKVDLTSLNNVDCAFCNYTGILGVFGDYFHNINVIESMDIFARGSESDIGDALAFLRKIRNVKDLQISFHFPNENVPSDFIIPVRNSLEVLEIKESKGTTLINPTMIKYIVKNNPNLKTYILHFEDFQTYKMVIGTVVKEELSRRSNGCSHRGITFYVDTSIFEEIPELMNYFYSDELPYNDADTIPDYYLLYLNVLDCLLCGGFDSIKIFEDEY
uniref:F-box domain-containing protein n=1 Tax=Strongyloides venezuelensis TaxID=75913 RepID=A0A0K0FGS7_STRVS